MGQDGDGAYYENQLTLRPDLENFKPPNIISFVFNTYFLFLLASLAEFAAPKYPTYVFFPGWA
jgi:hypothetical protein